MLKSLKEDENSEVLWAKTIEDAKKGRMSMPVPLSEEDVQQFALSPRFCVAQGHVLVSPSVSYVCPFSALVVSGVDSEGQPKFRAVDDFTRSEVNANTAPTEKLGCDTLDMLWELIRSMKESFDSEVHRVAQSEHARRYCCAHACVSGGAVTFQNRC